MNLRKILGYTSPLFLLPLFTNASEAPGSLYQTRIKPILDSRCVQCHSCYNSPCQLNMASLEGLNRGLIQDFEVHTKRIHSAEPTRLGVDRTSIQGWREFSSDRSFQPVIGESEEARDRLNHSFLYVLTHHKADTRFSSLALNDRDDSTKEQAELSRSCPVTPDQLKQHLRLRPNAGMPYGLPALSTAELQAIKQWTEAGSPRSEPPAAALSEDLMVKRLAEGFLNQYISNPDMEEAKKQSLVSRYIYEHLFLAMIALNDRTGNEVLYRLVRAKAPCETGGEEYPTRRPWGDPGGEFYYCFKRIDQTIAHKNYLRYPIDEKRVRRWRDLFFGTEWKVTLPARGILDRLFRTSKLWPADVSPRDDRFASNPMRVYQDIPVKSRYQFLLDDARYIVDTFIRGPVCKGSTAVNSIDEQFHVFFVKPESDLMVRNAKYYEQAVPLQVLPAYAGSDSTAFKALDSDRSIRIAREQFRTLRDDYMGIEFPKGLSVADVWDGFGALDRAYSTVPNPNAALTVFRNHDSASVVNGLIGPTPKTVALVDYSIIERLVYNLVIGFDIYGDISHYVLTRMYMAYLRMEFEENFLNLLPGNVRLAMRKSWYVPARGSTERIANLINITIGRGTDKISRRYPLLGAERPAATGLRPFDQKSFYASDGTAQETTLRAYRRQILNDLRNRLGGAVVDNGPLNSDKSFSEGSRDVRIGNIETLGDFERELSKLSDLRALNAPWVLFMPETSLLIVDAPERSEIYTLQRNKEHFNIAWIGGESGRRNRAADSMIFYRGVGGSYPNHIFRVPLARTGDFLRDMNNIADAPSYEGWLVEFGNPRAGPGSERFWKTSDHLHRVFKASYPNEYGVFDYNRYGVDYRFHKDGDKGDPLVENLSDRFHAIIVDAFGEEQ